ncbi:ribose-phosphate diphosphokinase [Psychroserpens sp. NJDZ02]|uniref:ribose-phosphate diphosphokinase n=1 Tax=Psychroserpens sp. NJDZ02 TaxID=2570561 RepID=UPI0010A7E492|nr:ribose-phosphate diphosphokinase [Psychroserpens sp. NJDZ02]QCE40741.1 ribose-phosphate pyrophosphokinase [Psychroserpens sp. NJDZ02]
MYLNLDPQFTPFHSGENIEFETFTFSGGEPHIKILSDLSNVSEVTITTRARSFNDFGLLLLTIDALKRFYIQKINVFIPYFPAARQDRVMVKGEPLSVKVYADMLNQLSLNKVMVYDAHSEVTAAVLNNCESLSNHTFIKTVLSRINSEVLLISPDGGALKKIYKVSEFLGGVSVIECSKKRNVKNGKLEGFKVYEDDLKGQDCLIVDDICDGGRTFIGLAQELKNKNAGNLYLAVSHGIFNKGFEVLNQHFTKIFTTDSFKTIADGVEQITIKELLK